MGITKTQTLYLDTPAASIALSPDQNLLAVVGSHLFKVYTLRDNGELDEYINLRSSKNTNLNYSSSDVEFCPTDERVLASASTNGSVIIWNITKSGRAKLANLYKDHDRTVNRVNFHPSDQHLLLSGSQDGQMKLFDYRSNVSVQTFCSNSESVRDIQFNPFITHSFAAGTDSCNVQLWDMRRPDKYERLITGHRGPVFALDWHPQDRHCIATASRDCTIKIWDVSETATVTSAITTVAAVARVKWRPSHYYHLASCSLTVDSSACIWDVQRPFVPIASFAYHRESTSALQWRPKSNSFITVSKDGRLFHHCLADAHSPRLRGCPSPLMMSCRGILAFSAPIRSLNKERGLCHQPVSVPVPVHHKRQTSLTHPLIGSTPSSPATPSGPSSFTPSERLPTTPLNPATPTLPPNPNNNADLNLDILNFPPPNVGMRQLATFEDIGPILSEFTLVSTEEDCIDATTMINYGKHYRLEGESDMDFYYTCVHNANVSADNYRVQEEATWDLMRIFYLGDDLPPKEPSPPQATPAAADSTVPSPAGGATTATSAAGPSGGESKSKDDSTCSDKTVPVRSPSKEEEGDGDDRTVVNEDGEESHSDEELDDRFAGQSAKFSSMFGNRTLAQSDLYFGDGDYFGNLPTQPNSRRTEPNRTGSRKNRNSGPPLHGFVYDRVLSSNEELFVEQNEAFEPKALQTYLDACEDESDHEGAEEEELHHSVDSGGEGDNGENENEDDNDGSEDCVLQDAMPLCVSPSFIPGPLDMDYTENVIETIYMLGDRGDVATCVTLILVLGDRLQDRIPLDIVEHWFLAYIDQLQRFQLFNTANVIIKKAEKFPEIQQMNQKSTVVTVLCPQCQARLPPRAFCCRKCRYIVNKCSWCQDVVTGLYVMCQGCCHGGHLHHLADWFEEKNTKASTSAADDVSATSAREPSLGRQSTNSSTGNLTASNTGSASTRASTPATSYPTYNGNPFLGHQVTSNVFASPSNSTTNNFTEMGNLVCPAGCGHLCQYM